MKVNVILVNNEVKHVIIDYKEALNKYRELRDKALLKVYATNDKYDINEDIDTYSISISVKTPELYSVKMFNCDVE